MQTKPKQKKYKLREDGRIEALRSFGSVKAGDVGGYIDSERNLSHRGVCWVFDDALVSGKAVVSGSAEIRDNALVTGNARVYGRTVVDRHAYILGDAQIGRGHITGNMRIERRSRKPRPLKEPQMSPIKEIRTLKTTLTYEEINNDL